MMHAIKKPSGESSVRFKFENLAKIVPASASQYIAMIQVRMMGGNSPKMFVLGPIKGGTEALLTDGLLPIWNFAIRRRQKR
jgi:hypothetical protein